MACVVGACEIEPSAHETTPGDGQDGSGGGLAQGRPHAFSRSDRGVPFEKRRAVRRPSHSNLDGSSVTTPKIPDRQGAAWVSATIEGGGYRTVVRTRTHSLVADEPLDVGGTDAGASPYELLLGALAACTAMTVRMYADRKKWPLTDVVVRIRPVRSHAVDCANCETQAVGVGRLEREVEFLGALTEEQLTRLRYIADRCPVKQTLERGLHIETAPAGAP
jgi:putative redox protein